MLEHILTIAMDALNKLFLPNNLSRPCAWGEVSARYLEVMHVLIMMGDPWDVHKGLKGATLDMGRLILKPESMMRQHCGLGEVRCWIMTASTGCWSIWFKPRDQRWSVCERGSDLLAVGGLIESFPPQARLSLSHNFWDFFSEIGVPRDPPLDP